jgi:hypothetical protein
MIESTWHIAALAVRRYLEVTGDRVPFETASERLQELCGEVRQRYRDRPELKPRLTDSGALVYRGPAPERLRLLVALDKHTDGRTPALIDILPGHSGFRRRPDAR